MKTNTTIFILYALCATSCRTQRMHKHSAMQEAQARFEQRLFYQFLDSTTQQWVFQSDSPFVYYPDSLLSATSGAIWWQQTKREQAIGELQQDSSSHAVLKKAEMEKERLPQSISYYPLLLSIVIIFLIFMGFRYTKQG